MKEPGKELGSVQQEARTCPVCGTKFFATADSGFCPVCILRGATSGESATTREPGSVSASATNPGETEGTSQTRRFEHYEVMLDEEGKPIELGRGAMGITYKAFDVDLRYPVTLKVITEKYLGEERLRKDVRELFLKAERANSQGKMDAPKLPEELAKREELIGGRQMSVIPLLSSRRDHERFCASYRRPNRLKS